PAALYTLSLHDALPISHMGDRLQAHILRSLGRECRAKSAGAVEDELLDLLEDRLSVGALRIDPEFKHAAGAGERAGNLAVAFDLDRKSTRLNSSHVAIS